MKSYLTLVGVVDLKSKGLTMTCAASIYHLKYTHLNTIFLFFNIRLTEVT